MTAQVARLTQLRSLAERYTAAWCSQDAASVAAFYSPQGSLRINDSPPAVGREAITEAAQTFMTSLPDLKVIMDGLDMEGDRAVYRWTLTGTNTGPGGTGKRIRISGFEEWQIGAEGLIAESRGHFDSAEYQRQLEQGVVED
jgi:predicted ester cyclase